MSGIWKIRILITCVFGIALYMGYGMWNDHFEAKEVLVGATWEVPLSYDYGSWEDSKRETEEALNGLELTLELADNPNGSKYNKKLLGVKNQDGMIIIPPIYEYLTVNFDEGYLRGENYSTEKLIYELYDDPTGINEYISEDRSLVHYYAYDGTDMINVPIDGTLVGLTGDYIFVKKDSHIKDSHTKDSRIAVLHKDGNPILDFENISINRIFDKELGIFEFSNYDEVYKRSDYAKGLMDASGKILLEAQYGEITRVSENRICVSTVKHKGPNMFYLDNEYNPLSEKQYNSISDFDEGVAIVSDAKGWHVINEDEEIIADIPKALEVTPFSEGIAVAQYKGEYQYIDTVGNVLFARSLPRGKKYIDQGERAYSEGRIAFTGENKKLGFMDKEGRVIVEPIFNYTTGSYKGTAYVTIGDKGGVIRF